MDQSERPRCATCDHWWKHSERKDGSLWGTCRHDPPVVLPNGDDAHPCRDADDGCSRHTDYVPLERVSR
jgi:hypothetical protein